MQTQRLHKGSPAPGLVRPRPTPEVKLEKPTDLSEASPESGDGVSLGAALGALALTCVGALATPAQAQPVQAQTSTRLTRSGRFDEFEVSAVRMDEEGPRVTAIRQALIDSGFQIKGGAEGPFDLFTLLAVTNFRDSQNLEDTWGLDAATWQRLDEVAPRAGLKAWEDPDLHPEAAPEAPQVLGKPVRALVDTSEHRLFLYDHNGGLEHIYSVATGDGEATQAGLKMVVVKNPNPESEAERLWGANKRLVFGTRLLNLSWVNLEQGTVESSDQELHGTYVEESIGLDISLGCMRLRNQDMEEVYEQLEVNDLIMVRP